MRQLATISRIIDKKPIPEADLICAYKIAGWWIVDTKDKYKVGDLVIYLEVDSWVPTTIAPFLSKGQEPREYNGIKGERLRTVKLKGQLSQGLILPLSLLTIENRNDGVIISSEFTYNSTQLINQVSPSLEGIDVSDILGIQKWEPPTPACLAGLVKGSFPGIIPKTDQERIQSLAEEWVNYNKLYYTVEEKLDGSSMTAYYIDNEFGVCSRNLDLKPSEDNTFWKMAYKYDLESKLKLISEELESDCAVSGEVIGEGIQSNKYKLKGQDFYVFDIFSVKLGKYISPIKCKLLCDKYGLNHVPVIEELYIPGTVTVDQVLELADGQSQLYNTAREGLVFKSIEDPNIHWKVISNKFLLKHGE